MNVLATPIAQNIDPAAAQAELEAQRQKVLESGKKFGAKQQGQNTYCLFNHTEAGFPNIHIHYPLPWFESWDGLTQWCYANPMASNNNINRVLHGSVGDERVVDDMARMTDGVIQLDLKSVKLQKVTVKEEPKKGGRKGR